MNDNELMNRRRFFKKTAKEMLPMLGAFVAAPTVIMSTLTSCGCDDCEAACQDDCEGTCKYNCYDSCSSSSGGGGCSDCSSSCSGSSTSITCSSCANDCTSSCKDKCQTVCTETCLSSCEGSSTGKPSTGIVEGHEYVDLGLSVLWATCNLGASKDSEIGDLMYFVYPDVSYWMDWVNKVEKHNFKEGDSISGTYLDSATKAWGSKWRMPSKDEIEELSLHCDIEFINNIGLRLTSRINGNTILFPSTKHIYDGKTYWDQEYWSGTIYNDYKSGEIFYAHSLWTRADSAEDTRFKKTISHIYWPGYKRDELPIRPVLSRSEGNVSTCNGSCKANCSSDCSSTCKNECSGTCKGSCGNDCTGGCKEGCSTGCKTTCKGECTGECKGTCTGGCSSGCTGGCKGTCSGNCGYGCSGGCSSCTATCADSCKAQTSQGCEGCSNTCKTGCGRQCYWSCGGSCDKQCEGACITGCQGYNRGSCSGTCFGSCSTQCSSSCRSYCYSSCTNMGVSGT